MLWSTRSTLEFPPTPVLRGVQDGVLSFPRGRVLAGGDAERPIFSITPIDGASQYRVVLSSHAGGAFENGDELETLEGTSAELHARTSLGPGHYTWEAWAVVDGLDRRLGARDFRVVADEPLRRRLADVEPLERVHALHTAGFLTDARQAALAMPPSDARDAYLAGLEQR